VPGPMTFDNVYGFFLRFVVYPHHHLAEKTHADELNTDNDKERAEQQERPAADVLPGKSFPASGRGR